MSWLLDLASPWAYVLVGLLALAEGGLLIGLFLPGEASLLLGGVLAYQGRASLAVMILVACAGAIVGDSIGYELGRHFGRRLERTRIGQRIGEERWNKARDYVRKRGGRAVFIGRFLGFLRSLVPPVAGDAGVSYPRFLVANAAAGTIWAGGFVLLGFAAGSSWHVVEEYSGQASVVLLGMLALAAVLIFCARRVARHAPAWRARSRDLLARPTVRAVRERYASQLAFLRRRFEPGPRLGLYLTVSVAVAMGAAWIFGALLHGVLEANEIRLFDGPIVRWVARHREPTMNDIMKVVTFFGGAAFVSAVLGTAALIAFLITRSLKWPSFLAMVLVGGLSLYTAIKPLIGRTRPDLNPLLDPGGFSFPSGHATASAAMLTALAYVLSRKRSWGLTVWIWTLATFLALVIGFSRVYLGVHWPTDVLAGWCLGAAWAMLWWSVALRMQSNIGGQAGSPLNTGSE